MSVYLDVIMGGAALAALACVMIFLGRQPGRGLRREMQTVLLKSKNSTGPKWPEHCVFISYRRVDSADVVERLYEHLTASLGPQSVFKDIGSLSPGTDFRAQLDASLKVCHVFLCVMGDRWAGPDGAQPRPIDRAEDYVRIEVETALSRNIPVIPIFVHNARMPAPEFFPASIREVAFRHGLPLRADPDFRNDFARLVASVLVHLSRSAADESARA